MELPAAKIKSLRRREPLLTASAETVWSEDLEALAGELEELGLSQYEARILTTLLRLGASNTQQLAGVSGVPRTSIYQVLGSLRAKHLADRVPTEGPAVWATPTSDEVLDRLDAGLVAAHEERLKRQRLRGERVRELITSAIPEAPSAPLAYVHHIHGAARTRALYADLLARAEAEVLVFNRPPYAQATNRVDPAILDALSRGVTMRAIYQAAQFAEDEPEGFREMTEAYHAAGVEGRVVDELAIKLVVVDRKVTLLAMPDPVQPDTGFPTNLLVEHPGFASVQANAFEQQWALARPYERGAPAARHKGGTSRSSPGSRRATGSEAGV